MPPARGGRDGRPARLFSREADVTLLHTIHDKMKNRLPLVRQDRSSVILAMMALISYDVFLRYILNDPMLGAHEWSSTCFSCAFSSS
jgi:TRAP-type mannitol/chloroaromatic compound transport system permease small subunit